MLTTLHMKEKVNKRKGNEKVIRKGLFTGLHAKKSVKTRTGKVDENIIRKDLLPSPRHTKENK